MTEKITIKSIELVNKLIETERQNVVAIAFPGQTISHNDDFSLQAGSPEIIAKQTKIPVYSDFRNFDIGKGGKGAPLIPAFISTYYQKRNRKISTEHWWYMQWNLFER